MSDTCIDCAHWIRESVYDNFGECAKIHEALDIEVNAGWDGGTVGVIETDSDFGCNLFIRKGER